MNILVAHDDNRGIGKDNAIPWDCKEDMQFFKKITTDGTLVMGRKTWTSLSPWSRKSLNTNGRRCIVVTSNPCSSSLPIDCECEYVTSYEEAKQSALEDKTSVFFIGGVSVYEKAIKDPDVENMYVTRIKGSYDCDTFMPRVDFESKWMIKYRFQLAEGKGGNRDTKAVLTQYKRKHEESQYLDLLLKLITSGSHLNDRTGIGIYSLFGAQMRFDCSTFFPLLTTKKTYFKGIVEELLWFMKGRTDSKELESVGVNIWRGNTSREYLDDHGFHDREVGDIGPGYGHQWRHWNATYSSPAEDYTDKGIDQLKKCIQDIKKEKETGEHDRRIVMIAWNPEQIADMSLPPCHVLVQFYLNRDNLSLHMYQRSADMFLGVPFNIASYALLLKIVAKLSGTKPKDLIMSFGDVHLYTNHLFAVTEQLKNSPHRFPTISLDIDENMDIEDITSDRIKLNDYSHHPAIRAPMAV